jgi:hypothetical protein
VNEDSFLSALLAASTAGEAPEATQTHDAANEASVEWLPVGGKENNRGPIEVSADPGRSLIERVTN